MDFCGVLRKAGRHHHLHKWTSPCGYGTEVSFTRRNGCIGGLSAATQLHERNPVALHL